MVQNVGNKSNSASPYGSIDRVGTTQDGRVIYRVVDPNGKIAGGLSVAAKDSDTFERSYNQIMEATPKLEKYMQTHTKDDIKKAQKRGRWISAIGAFTGGIFPATLIKNQKQWVKIVSTIGGTIAGLFVGLQIAKKATVPPGAEEMTKASQAISKLDIKPIKG